MPLQITNKDLASLSVDALVNPTDINLSLHELGPTPNDKLRSTCAQLRSLRVGDIRITQAYGLPASQIAHMILPEKLDDLNRIRDYYKALFNTARQYGWRSIGLPLFPVAERTTVPVRTVYALALEAYRHYSEKRDLQVYLVIKENTLRPDEGLLLRLLAYVNARLAKPEVHSSSSYGYGYDNRPTVSAYTELDDGDAMLSVPSLPPSAFSTLDIEDECFELSDFELSDLKPIASEECSNPYDDPRSDADMDAIYYKKGSNAPNQPEPSIPEEIDLTLDESFASAVLRLESIRGLTDPQLYSRSNLSRAVFNKLKQSALRPHEVNYQPSKNTALALCIGLQLGLSEAEELLKKAGYSISHSSKGDLIVEYFLKHNRFDIFEVNEMLFRMDQVPLGSF